MRNANVETKKIVKAAQPRRVAGVQVRSGVKAGVFGPEPGAGPGPGFGPGPGGR
jgi:hypothetical protein